jgi:hypothetical protein
MANKTVSPPIVLGPESFDNEMAVRKERHRRYLAGHLTYLEEELGKHPDKPDVQARLKLRIKEVSDQLKVLG